MPGNETLPDVNDQAVTRSGARRLGDDYQDIVALDVLVEWLEHPDRFRWAKVEADEMGVLDDVIALRTDGSIDVKQVKYSVHPDSSDDPWTWHSLVRRASDTTERARRSLLERWADSLEDIRAAWPVHEAALVSNRRAAPDLKAALSLPTNTAVPAKIEAAAWAEIVERLGGEQRARSFLVQFSFDLDRPTLDALHDSVRRRFYRLGGTEQGWLGLKDTLRAWVCRRDEPRQNREIHLQDVMCAALWYNLQQLPQRFEIPGDYVLPSESFHEEVVQRIQATLQGCILLTAQPGLGKSTYASYLHQDLQGRRIPVVRHHYFLSLADHAWSERLESGRAAESLMHDLLYEHSAALETTATHNPSPDQLRQWLETCGSYYSARGQALVVIIDGLDHVWRELRSAEELEKLFRHLLPALPGVILFVATQPIDEGRLPGLLVRAAPRERWIELPALDEHAVRQWFGHHEQELGQSNMPETQEWLVERLAGALHRRSRGHPLHLRYTVRALQEQGLLATEATIDSLPDCPHQQIRDYYASLWRSLSENAREILHLLAACRFPWPRQGILACMDPEGSHVGDIRRSLSEVGHLLVQDPLGFRPYHSSLLSFVCELSEHYDYAAVERKRARQWLLDRAPEHWRWAYTWILDAQLGDTRPLLEGPSREWAVAAVAQRRSPSEIERILDQAIAAAADASDLPRAVELGVINDYTLYFNTDELDAEALDNLLFPQLVVEEDGNLRARLLSSLDELSDGAIARLAEAEARAGNSQIVDLCFQTLNQRLRFPRQKDRARARNREDQLTAILTVAGMPGGPDPERTLRFAIRNRSYGHTRKILAVFAAQLRRWSDADRFRQSLRPVWRWDLDSEQEVLCGDDRQLKKGEDADLLRHAALLGLEQGLDLSDLLADPLKAGDPFALIYSACRGGMGPSATSTSFPETEVLRLKHYYHHERSDEIVDFFYRSFFGFLANALQEHEGDSLRWLDGVGESTWQYRCLRHLNSVAKQAAGILSARSTPSLGWFYSELDQLARPQWRADETAYSYSVAAADAAIDIGLDLLSIAQGAGADFHISESDLERVLSSDWCVPKMWLARYVARRRATMTVPAVRWLLARECSELAKTIETFPERSDRYCLMASVAAVHGMHNEARALIHSTADNLVTHGYHKDVLFHQLFDAILAYHQAMSRAELPQPDLTLPQKWVVSLAPAIAAIEEYTDGDETGELPRRLADLLAEVAWNLLPAYYEWLADREEHYDALHAFHVILRSVDLSSVIYQAVAQTGVDRESLSILQERSRLGDQHAHSVLQSLLKLLGESALQPPLEVEKEETQSAFSDAKQKPLPDPAHFGPGQFNDYVSALSAQHDVYRDEHVCDWIDFWVRAGRKVDVLTVLEKAQERGISGKVSDRMFSLSRELQGREKAYNWLIQAQIESFGWQSYWSAAEKARERWKTVKELYPERWFQFLRDTIRDRNGRDKIAIGHGTIRRMVEYCLFMEQCDVARDIIERTDSLALQLVSPLNLPVPEWSLIE